MKILNSISQLRSYKGYNNYVAQVGDIMYRWDDAATGVDDDENIIAVTGYVGNGRWIIINRSEKVIALTANKTISQSDHRTMHYTTDTPVTIDVQSNGAVPTSIGTQIDFFQVGTGTITFSANAGVTIVPRNGVFATSVSGDAATLKKLFANTWALIIGG